MRQHIMGITVKVIAYRITGISFRMSLLRHENQKKPSPNYMSRIVIRKDFIDYKNTIVIYTITYLYRPSFVIVIETACYV